MCTFEIETYSTCETSLGIGTKKRRLQKRVFNVVEICRILAHVVEEQEVG